MSKPSTASDYQSYLLRLWKPQCEYPDASIQWRCSLESVLDGMQIRFPNLKSLVCFLRTQTEEEDEESTWSD